MPWVRPGGLPVMSWKVCWPGAELGQKKVEGVKIGGFSEPSDKAGSKPWPIISVEGFNLRPPISSISGLGLRRGVVAGGAASSLVLSGMSSSILYLRMDGI